MDKVCKDCKVTKPLSEYYKSKSYKDGFLARCKPCHIYVSNKSAKRRYQDNLEQRKEYNRKYYEVNSHLYQESNKERAAKWYQDNRERGIQNARQREGLQKSATPRWLTESNLLEIKYIYQHAKDCQAISGEVYEVDHIIPIRGKDICGLHVPWNLQVLPMDLNRKKSNNYTQYQIVAF